MLSEPLKARIGGRRLVALAGLVLLGTVLVAHAASPTQAQEGPRCGGLPPTIAGTADDDVLVGTPRRDVIWGGPGDDVILGLDGHDVICGGPGDDLIFGGDGVDRIYGGAGDDVIHGGLGSDVLRGGPGDDVIHGERGNDEIRGGPGDDRLFGGHGDDLIFGGAGDDFIHGGLGIDVLKGGPGNDTIDGGYGWDLLDGGRGNDTVSFASAPRSEERKRDGVHVSLRTGRAYGDGRDRLRRFQNVVGSAFDDVLIGKGRNSRLYGGPGKNACRGVPRANRISCGRRQGPRARVNVHFDTAMPDPRGAGVLIAGGRRNDTISLSFDREAGLLSIAANAGIAIHSGCTRPDEALDRAICPVGSAPRWVTVDLGRGNDRYRTVDSLRGVGEVRIAGGPGNDVLRGGEEDSLLHGGPGSDRIFGGGGQDALVAGHPGGPNYLDGGPDGNLLASGLPCSGGRIVGGSGSDNVSFAELPIQRGVLYASLARGIAYVQGQRNCRPVRIDSSIENLEGSFGADILIGDHRDNNILGQPGADRFFGGGGDNVIDARDGRRDKHIQCGRRGSRRGLALIDRRDPAPRSCAEVRIGEPIPGLPK